MIPPAFRRVVALIAAVPLAAGLMLAACSREDGGRGSAAPPPADAPAVQPRPDAGPDAGPEPGPTVGGDGSGIELSVLSPADLKTADLQGELGCVFTDAAGGALLVAKGDVASSDHAFGVVKVGQTVEPVAAPGGFDGMLRGAVFSGAGKAIRIVPSGPAVGGGESPPHPARLTYMRADGAARAFAGQWTCGP